MAWVLQTTLTIPGNLTTDQWIQSIGTVPVANNYRASFSADGPATWGTIGWIGQSVLIDGVPLQCQMVPLIWKKSVDTLLTFPFLPLRASTGFQFPTGLGAHVFPYTPAMEIGIYTNDDFLTYANWWRA